MRQCHPSHFLPLSSPPPKRWRVSARKIKWYAIHSLLVPPHSMPKQKEALRESHTFSPDVPGGPRGPIVPSSPTVPFEPLSPSSPLVPGAPYFNHGGWQLGVIEQSCNEETQRPTWSPTSPKPPAVPLTPFIPCQQTVAQTQLWKRSPNQLTHTPQSHCLLSLPFLPWILGFPAKKKKIKSSGLRCTLFLPLLESHGNRQVHVLDRLWIRRILSYPRHLRLPGRVN